MSNHIWQSTFFALAIALLTLAFRTNKAQVRYWLWLAASLKFLLPFAPLMSLGAHVDAPRTLVTPAVSVAIVQISEPFEPPSAPVKRNYDWILPVLWTCGSAAIVGVRIRGWRRIRAALNASTPIDIPCTVGVRTSPGLMEPGVVGFFRPVLLLPAGITARLTPAELDAVLAHEMSHVRRRDNATSALHMIVEAIFWFHPLVWWIGARLIEERERACDEAVESDAQVYAAGILNVCKSYLESPVRCVSGVTGADLKKRIHAILAGRVARELTPVRKTALAAAAMVALAAPIVAGIAQAVKPTPKWDVVSIRPCKDVPFGRGGGRGPAPSPGRLDLPCRTVEQLIATAYDSWANGFRTVGRRVPIEGADGWMKSDHYSIEAKAETPENRGTMMGPMLRTILEDKFKLKIREETREVPVYFLTVAKGGPKNMTPAKDGACKPLDMDHPPAMSDHLCDMRSYRNGIVEWWGTRVASMADFFSIELDRGIIDQTGLKGVYDVHMELAEDELPRPNADGGMDLSRQADSAFAEIKRLGLKLTAGKGPGKYLIVEHAEKPPEN